jgi:hypothetical protein
MISCSVPVFLKTRTLRLLESSRDILFVYSMREPAMTLKRYRSDDPADLSQISLMTCKETGNPASVARSIFLEDKHNGC